MLLKVSDISNRMISANVFPDNAKLFGAVYIGYDQYITIIQANSFSTVGAALISGGYAITGDAYTDNLYCFQFIDSIENLISVAENTIIQNQTAIEVVSELNAILTNQSYTVPPSLIQQPVSIVGNVYTVQGNVTIITIDGVQNYYGGNINVAPGFGGGAFPYTSSTSSTAYYTTIAKTRYLDATLSYDSHSNLGLSRATGIGINVGSTTNTQIGDLATTIGAVNIVVGPVDAPQPSQETLQNSFITNMQVAPGIKIQTQISTSVTPPVPPPSNTCVSIGTSTVTVTPPSTPPTVQVTTQYITKTVEYISGTLYGSSGSTTTTISYNVVTKGNTIYPDGTTFQTSSSYSNANISNWGDSTVTTINVQTVIS
jgi:hypothetical protein